MNCMNKAWRQFLWFVEGTSVCLEHWAVGEMGRRGVCRNRCMSVLKSFVFNNKKFGLFLLGKKETLCLWRKTILVTVRNEVERQENSGRETG